MMRRRYIWPIGAALFVSTTVTKRAALAVFIGQDITILLKYSHIADITQHNGNRCYQNQSRIKANACGFHKQLSALVRSYRRVATCAKVQRL